ncbi:hypothetical protein STEG23_014423, partial [Scotinomys teguina]
RASGCLSTPQSLGENYSSHKDHTIMTVGEAVTSATGSLDLVMTTLGNLHLLWKTL